MGIVSKLYKAYVEETGVKALPFLFKMLGLDADVVEDEEVWRTNEEGNHFKFDDQTGEIKAGFGGKYNGQKLGGKWPGAKQSRKSSGGVSKTTGEGFKVPGPERSEKPKGKEVGMSFGHNSDGSERSDKQQKEYLADYNYQKKEAERVFRENPTDAEAMSDAVSSLFHEAQNSDAYHRAQHGIAGSEAFGLGKIPREWEARLTPTERDVLENIVSECEDLNWQEMEQWQKNNPDADYLMQALQAKLLGAEIEPELSDDILSKYAGIEKREETPGQTSMFWGENVPGSYEGAVQTETKSAPELREAAPQSKWAKEQERRRAIASKWSDDRKAEYAFREGIATEEEAIEAMNNGTAQELIDRYYDAMEYNGDPTPTKPIRKAPDLYTEIQEGKHGGDYVQARKDYIKEWTGMSDEEVETAYENLHTWFGGSWYSADTDTLDKYIDADGAYDGEIFRGMHFTQDEYDAFMSDVRVGAKIGMNGHNSSWTDNREDAWNYCRNGERQVIITCKKNKTSAPVKHLSMQGENEVLAHSKTQWTVLGVKVGDRRTEITVIEAEDRMSTEERDRRKRLSDAAPNAKKDGALGSRMNEQTKFMVVTPAPEWLYTKNAEDGGPGSGNWGHHGRPGKRGGSGKGGGVQYRGGRADVRYVGSRKDWLNGMTGENQNRAEKFIAKAVQAKNDKLEQKSKLEKLAARGLLTYPEVEERMKQERLDKLSSDMTPEQYVMQVGSKDEREELLNYVQSGRGWGEHADRLTQENWNENDRKLADVLCNKYGLMDVDGVAVPDDSNTQGWEEQDLLCWYDLKAKAMELPTSGDEAPDELQYAAGLKERPVLQTNPWKNVEGSLYEAANHLAKASGMHVDPDVLYNGKSVSGVLLADIEKASFERALARTGYQADRGLKLYLRSKLEAVGGNEAFLKQAEQYLSQDELSEVKKAMADASYQQEELFDNLDFYDQMKRLRIDALLNKGMGGPDCTALVEQKRQEKEAEEAERRRQEEEYRRKKEEAERQREAERERTKQEAEAKRKEELKQGITTATKAAEYNNVGSNPPKRLEKELGHDDIVSRISGPDKTKGSCASAAMTYVANKFGYDVLDFRGGTSQAIFAKKSTIKDLAETPGVDGFVIEPANGSTTPGKSEILSAQEALSQMETGKEYIMSCGEHCSIVRRNENGQMEYLELQSSNSGFKPFEGRNGAETLRKRFGCKRSRSRYGYHFEVGAVIIDIEKLRGCKAFENALQYINTNESEQKKGAGGGVK